MWKFIGSVKPIPDFSQVARHKSDWSCWPPTMDPEEIEKRSQFWKLEKLREAVVDLDALTTGELQIHRAHELAVKSGHFTYEDPLGGGTVSTRYKHFLTGLCCGNACRHCTFNFYNVPKYLKIGKSFNSSFWTESLNEAPVEGPSLKLNQFLLRRLVTK